MDIEPKNILDAYRQISRDTNERLIYLSLSMMGAILFMCSNYGVDIWKVVAFIGLYITIGVNVLYYLCSLKHYEDYMNARIDSIDYRAGKWGRWARGLRWVFIVMLAIASIIFIVALLLQAQTLLKPQPKPVL